MGPLFQVSALVRLKIPKDAEVTKLKAVFVLVGVVILVTLKEPGSGPIRSVLMKDSSIGCPVSSAKVSVPVFRSKV